MYPKEFGTNCGRCCHLDSATLPKSETLTSATTDIILTEQPTVIVIRLGHFPFDLPEDISAFLQAPRGPELLVDVSGAQSCGSRLFKSALFAPQCSLHLHSVTREVCGIDRVWLGMFNVSLCVVEPALLENQAR